MTKTISVPRDTSSNPARLTLPCISVCTGIGGFELGLIYSGLSSYLHPGLFIEKDNYCQSVLKKHFPSIPIQDEFKSTTGEQVLASLQQSNYSIKDVFGFYGGIPCQPHSLSGKQEKAEDERDLFQDFHRVIREVQEFQQIQSERQPVFAIIENVPGLLFGSKESGYFHKLLEALTKTGFIVEWHLTRASSPAIGGLHRRERLWILAYTPCQRFYEQWGEVIAQNYQKIKSRANSQIVNGVSELSNSEACRPSTQSSLCDWTHGLSERLAVDNLNPEDKITSRTNLKERLPDATDNNLDPMRKDKLRALGNAIVPQQAAQVWTLLDKRLNLSNWMNELYQGTN